jgi:peptidoglycan/xylan/chitin deacetylase (PgdA/CDA1 family)
VRRLLPASVRRPLRRVADALARLAGVPFAVAVERVLRLSGRRAGVALVYHRVGDPPGDPRRELNPALGTALFESQLGYLRRRHRVVPARELAAAVAARRRGEPFPVAITFDDDLRSHAEAAAPALLRQGMPATFFLCGAGSAFWWDALQSAFDRGLELEPTLAGAGGIREAAAVVEELSPSERDALAHRLGALAGGVEPETLSDEEIGSLAGGGLEVGFHTLRHHPLTQLGDADLAAALREGRERLAAAAGTEPDAIAYPHGRADARVAAAARAAGWRLGFTTRPCAVTPDSDPLLLGRVEAPFTSTGSLALVLARALWGRSC